ncbi:hypothetical protein E3Q23_01371 [Wallemia mellicola]|uniref:Pyruvate kinase n=1 Tax=Wallemia mellicola TaxID=1708541 RepID=A0A4T0TP05_9BASI|nr:hypothetical protein E3Q24_01653 [Wallemia mellicola]TIB77339.1 hypothetical protein E3Q23_01371 [Wallemia mellicola]TIB85883.1 pyruvate kinase [Wallemia mellicola]TIB88991.1 pyruvate kinase [Wallemia mellicola]TIC01738.1 pyruvate kinase [Wallemia mellicola]
MGVSEEVALLSKYSSSPDSFQLKDSHLLSSSATLTTNLIKVNKNVLMSFESLGSTNTFQWLANLGTEQNTENKHFLRKTSIIATIGPKVNNVESLTSLREAGMNIVRMNFSHGSYEYHQSVIDNVRTAVAANPDHRPLAIALDTKGPEIRTGLMKGGDDIKVAQGHEMYVTVDPAYAEACDDQYMYVDYTNIVNVIEPGKLIYVDDGILSLLVLAVEGKNLKVRCLNNGVLSSRKGVNLPKTDVDLPALSEKDRNDLQFGVKNNVDIVFASFIRRADDVKEIRKVLGEAGKNIKIIVKIENQQGVNNFDEILRETDGVMVARGDLGIEIPASQVFMAQKMMISKCNIVGKPVICATQMLESMTFNPRPTRAEVSDVANAVLDGADCVMLSGETAKGTYPIESVKLMGEVCLLAEHALANGKIYQELRALAPRPMDTTETISSVAVSAAIDQGASAILVMSTSGNTARLLSKYRPRCPILCVTRNEQTSRQLHLSRGVYPIFYNESRPQDESNWQVDVDNRIRYGLKKALDLGIVEKGTTVLAVQGWKGNAGHSNTLRILSVPENDHEYALHPIE